MDDKTGGSGECFGWTKDAGLGYQGISRGGGPKATGSPNLQAKIRSMATALGLWAILTCAPAWGERYSLFTAPGVQRPDYAEVIDRLKPDDVLVFSNGAEFAIKGFLGFGGTTLIIDTGRRGLRIPLGAGIYVQTIQEGTDVVRFEKQPYTWYITQFIAGQRVLRRHEVPVVDMYDALEEEYVEVEKVTPLFTYREYYRTERAQMRPSERARVDQHLLEWLAPASIFAQIGDFHADQLVYLGDRWIVLDHTNLMLFSRHYNDPAPFVVGRWNKLMAWMGRNYGLPLPADLHDRAREVIEAKRKAEGQRWGIFVACSQTLDFFSDMMKLPKQVRQERVFQVPQ